MVITNFAPPMDSALGDRLGRLNGSAGPGSHSFQHYLLTVQYTPPYIHNGMMMGYLHISGYYYLHTSSLTPTSFTTLPLTSVPQAYGSV